jgi:hypothetical protein
VLVADGAANNGATLHVGCNTVRKEEGHEARRLISFLKETPERIGGRRPLPSINVFCFVGNILVQTIFHYNTR